MPIRTLQDYKATRRISPAPVAVPAITQPPPITDVQVRDPVISTPRQPSSPFAELDVWPSINGATIITWQQNAMFRGDIPDDTELILEFSYANASDSWLLVSINPITYYLTDTVQRFKGQTINGAYRLRLRGADFEYVSEPITLFKKLSFTEYRTALKIIRAENRQLYHKSPGYLLKRRHLGVRCNRCNDLLTTTATQDQCPICLGTNFIGGYFKPVPCSMEITLPNSNDQVEPSARGPINDGNVTGRLTALYFPEQNDVWADITTGNRYRIVGHKVICHQRSIPLVLMVELKHIPASDIVYSFKID